MKDRMKVFIQWPAFASLALLLLFLVINQILSPGYLNSGFITGFLAANAPSIIVTIGLSVVLISGGMDISLGGLICLINVIYVSLSMKGFGIGVCAAACVLVGVLGGLLNGICVAIFRVTPLLTTFATSYIFGGIALWIMPSPTGSVQMDLLIWYLGFGKGYAAPIIFIIMAIVLWLVVKRTKMGIWIYAVGQNSEKAYVSAVPVNKVKLFAYTFAGLLYGIGGFALTAYCGAGDPLIAQSMTMKVIAACVIGGILLNGGVGDSVGSIFGATFMGLVITTVLSSVNNSFFQSFAQGLIMLIGVVGSVVLSGFIKKFQE